MELNRKAYRKIVLEDIRWLERLMESSQQESSLEGKHILEILREIIRDNV